MSNFMGHSSLKRSSFSSIQETSQEKEITMSIQKSMKTQQDESTLQETTITSGNMIKYIKEGDKVTKFYSSFQYDGEMFELGDFILVKPAITGGKTLVGIIKAISSEYINKIMVTAQLFYHPEEAINKEGECYKAQDKRELLYSFRREDILAESISHKCIVHFIPLHKQLPLRTSHPGFIVQKVYGNVERKLHDLTDKDFDEEKQQEIDHLVKRTEERIGSLPNIVVKTPPMKKMDSSTGKQADLRRVEPTTAIDKLSKAYAGLGRDVSKYHTILANYKVLTGDAVRDKWLEKLLHGLHRLCSSTDDNKKGKIWPDAVVQITSNLERVTYEALGNNLKKYKQKLRQFEYNLQNSKYLVKRLLKREIEPIALLTMSPEELKEGLTADEMTIFEPEPTEQMQMTDVRCTICREKRVGIREVINAGGRGDRYKLECCDCGHEWFTFRDAIASSLLPTSNQKS